MLGALRVTKTWATFDRVVCYWMHKMYLLLLNAFVLSYVSFILPARVFVHYVHRWWPWRSEEDIIPTAFRVMDGYELPCRCWEPNLSPLQEQHSFLTTTGQT